MNELLQAVEGFLTEDDWPIHQIEGKDVLRSGFQGENGQWNCYAQANDENHIFIFYSVCPVTIPTEKRDAVAEFLTRANYGLLVGNFELDYADGEVRYKSSLDVENSSLSQPLFHNLVYANVWMMDRYLPGIMEVTYGNAFPLDAIRKIEGD
jgi:hypothetical protein